MASSASNTPGTSNSSSNSNSNNNDSSPKDNRWYFTTEQLSNSPSRRQGIDADQELSFRQLTAYLIQEMGQRLQVSQLCINTAIVYMHRFYAFHSFTHFHRNGIAAAALFLAAKVEEQPRKLEHVIKVAHMCLNQEAPHPSSDAYAEQAQDLVFNENVLLQTLGFDVAIDHPHTHVVKTCHLVKACKDLAQTSYFLASNSLHLTSMCLQYRPTVVACFCIYLACKWSRWEIPQSTEGRHWFHYVDKTVTMDLLKQLTDEFIAIYEKSPARLKSKLNSIKALAQGARISEPSRSDSSNGSAISQTIPLEPPPPRRPESHSSHHRSHHPSSSHPPVSSTHHHHNKLVNDGAEHKPSHKPSYPPTAGHSSRPRPERSQVTSDPQHINIPHGVNKQMPITSSSRSSSRPQHSIPPLVGAPSSVQRTSHNHDPNVYHKSRNSVPQSLSSNPQLPGHKVIQKIQDPARVMMKESSSRQIDPSKLPSKHSNNSIYSSQNSSTVGIDLTRSVLQSQTTLPAQQQQQHQQPPQSQPQQQRPYIPQSSSQPANYSQSVLNRGNSSRYDQSVQQPQSSQKQSIESSFSISNTKPDDNLKSGGDQMEICSPTKSSYPQNSVVSMSIQQQHQQPLQQQQKVSSIFSPEWNDRNSQINSLASNSNNKLGLNIKTNRDSPKKEKRSETPKKEKIRTEIQNQSVPPNKFMPQLIEKKPDVKSMDLSQPLSLATGLNNVPSQIILPPYDTKNQQTHPLNFSGIKRRASKDNIKFNEEMQKDLKIRKVEPQSPPKMGIFNMYDQTSSSLSLSSSSLVSENKQSIKTFPSTINGIETNPDLVSSLLKESLCRESKYSTPLIKTEPKTSSEQEPLVKVEPIVMETLPDELLQTDVPSVVTTDEVKLNIEHTKSKSEKKKKKEKHKHKEKDKSKDKEERKKHKKDKDRHKDKDKDRQLDIEQNPVKIKITKDKLNLSTNVDNNALKIKIPKDRIKTELTNFQIEGISSKNSQQQLHHHQSAVAPSSLKIKISNKKIENFNHQQQQQHNELLTFSGSSTSTIDSGISVSHYGGSHTGSNNNNSNSNSNKKKDRDRDREKDKDRKKPNSSEYGKHNGNNGNKEINNSSINNGNSYSGGGGGGGNVALYSNTSSKIQQSSNVRMHHQHHQQLQQQQQQQQQLNGSNNNNNNGNNNNSNNVSMSQLFGESYDDDDDDYDSSDNDYNKNNKRYDNEFIDAKVNYFNKIKK